MEIKYFDIAIELQEHVKPSITIHSVNKIVEDLDSAIFNQTNIKRALFEGETALNYSQISMSKTDSKTQLPDYLEEEMDDDFLLQM